jgi:gas vesicle protein
MITKIIIGVVIGGVLGFAAYRFVGCGTGACPLTSNPWISTLYGMLVGALIGSSFR